MTFIPLPSSALAPELTSDYNERTSIVSYRYLFAWIGGMAMLLLTFGFFLAPTAQYPIGQLNPGGYRTYAVVATLVMVTAILISAIGTHREIKRLPKAAPERGTLRETPGALQNRSFLILMPRISRRWGKRNASVAMMLLYIPIASAPYFLRPLGLFVGNDHPGLLPILLASTTVATALSVGVFILFDSMVSDVVEESQSRTGKRSEGAFFAGLFFMKKAVAGLAIFLSGALLGMVAFPEAAKPGEVPLAVLDRLSLGFAGLTVACGIAAILALLRYRMTRTDHEARITRLAELAATSPQLPDADLAG